jgi:hypothetical protein
MMAARQPGLPSLEQMLTKAEKQLAAAPLPVPAPPQSFVFAEDMVKELSTHLGISRERAIDSYRYLQSGEGMLARLLLVDANGTRPARAES